MVTTNALYSNLFLQMDFLFQFTSMHLSLFASFQGKTNAYLSIDTVPKYDYPSIVCTMYIGVQDCKGICESLKT